MSINNDMPEKFDPRTMDVGADNRARLRQMFPTVFTETVDDKGELVESIDFEKLKAEIGTFTALFENRRERYGMDWPGKKDCMKLIQQPSVATLKPCREESVNFDDTENLFIEGDNLEVLRLLQKSYYGKVKMIYIDPPYNTGKEFIYPDKYAENLDTYLVYAGLVDDEGRKFSTNTANEGRFHTKWLNMMYPRLYLARNLLREDGVIFISIDDNELSNLRQLCDEVFGEENFLNTIAVKLSEPTGVKMAHVEKRLPKLKEFIVIYKKADISITPISIPKEKWDSEYKYLVGGVQKNELQRLKEIMESEAASDEDIKEGDIICSKIYLSPIEALYAEYNAITEEDKINTKYLNAWRIVRDVATTGGAKDIADDKKRTTSAPFFLIMTPQKKKYLIKKDYKADSDQPRIKMLFADTYLTQNPGDFWQDIKTTGLDNEGGVDFKNGKKPVKMIERMLKATTNEEDIILDFFAGSCSTAHAVFELNKEDARKRRFIMVQLPEPCAEDTEAFRTGYKTIADIGKERIRRVIKKIESEQAADAKKADGKLPGMGEEQAKLDLGFKVLKLDRSNFKIWDGTNPDAKDEEIVKQLELHVDHIDHKATQEDILYELLLKSGFMPTERVGKLNMAGKTVYSIAGGALIICLEDEITKELIDAIADAEPIQVVCLDSGFKGNDQLKANTVQTFKSRNLGRDKSDQIVFKTV